MVVTLPMVKEKKFVPMTIQMVAMKYSAKLVLLKSPYPTVVVV